LNRAGLERPDLQLIHLGREARLINMTQLGQTLTGHANPPVKALVVYNSNPAAIAPNQNAVHRGLRRDDLFTVVLEQFQTDTAEFADVLLPVTTFLEHTDLYLAYGHYYLQLARPALPAPGETKSNVEIFRLLAERMGFQEECFRDSEDNMIRTALDSSHPFVSGISLDELEREGFVRLRLPEPFQPFAQGNFGSVDGKCHFRAESLDYQPPVESRFGDQNLRRQFPFELISPKNDDSMNSTFGNRDAVDLQTAAVHMHVADAARLGIQSSDLVRIYNQRGSCVLVAQVDSSVPPGVVSAPSVRWSKRAPDRVNINVLTSECLTDLGGGPTFYSCLVQLERIGD
jgi:anaerobic selenocysteine-containing dehydrogenase